MSAALAWESAGTDEPGDQNASQDVVAHGYWAIGPNHGGTWSVGLSEQAESTLHEVAWHHLGDFASEEIAKAVAAEVNSEGRWP